MVRPLLWMSIAFLAGASAGGRLPETWIPGALFAGTCVGLAAAILAQLKLFRRLRSPALLLVLFALLGLVAGRQAQTVIHPPASLAPFIDRPDTLYLGEITNAADIRMDRVRLTLRLHRAFHEGTLEPVGGAILLTVRLPPGGGASLPWHHGDWVLARLTLKRFQSFKNPGGLDYVRTQALRGIYARASVPDSRSVIRAQPPALLLSEAESSFPWVQSRLDRFRQSAFHWLKQRLSPDAGDFYGSLLLGYRIPPAWLERLSRSGVIHLLSISGLHLGLVSFGVFWIVCRILRWARPSLLVKRSDQHYAVWPALLAAAAYALVSGLALPTWRSLIMLALLMGSAFFHRFSDPITALAAAALLIVLLHPTSPYEISFQLSFLSMLGLFIIYPRLQDGLRPVMEARVSESSLCVKGFKPFADAFLASLAASILVLPVVAHHFHGISLAGFAANAVLVPMMSFSVLPLGLLALCLFAVHEALAYPFLLMGSFCLEVCLRLIEWFSDLSWAFVWTGALSTSHVFVIYGLTAILFCPWSRVRKLAWSAGLVLLLGIGAAWDRIGEGEAYRGKLRVTAIDVGQGSSTLVRFPLGHTMLVDGGGFPDESFDVGRMVVAPFLWREGIRKVDTVVLSHDHPDHRNGLRAILSHFQVDAFWDTGFRDRSSASDDLAAIAAKRAIPAVGLEELRAGRVIDGCRIRVLHPGAYGASSSKARGLNNLSLVLAIDHGETSALLPGDIDHTVERQLIPTLRHPGRVLLVAAHHGSETSNSEPFLEALKPDGIIVSCGSGNPFGFPSERLLAWCRTRATPCFRTDLHGAVEAVSNGTSWQVRSLGSP